MNESDMLIPSKVIDNFKIKMQIAKSRYSKKYNGFWCTRCGKNIAHYKNSLGELLCNKCSGIKI